MVAMEQAQCGHGHRRSWREKQGGFMWRFRNTVVYIRKRPPSPRRQVDIHSQAEYRYSHGVPSLSYDFYDVTIKTSEVSEHWKSQVDSKPWKYFLEMDVLPQPLNSSVTLDKSMDTSLSDFSHWLSGVVQPSQPRQSFQQQETQLPSLVFGRDSKTGRGIYSVHLTRHLGHLLFIGRSGKWPQAKPES